VGPRAQAKQAIVRWIEGWYNPRRLHSSFDYLTPNEKENTRSAFGRLTSTRYPARRVGVRSSFCTRRRDRDAGPSSIVRARRAEAGALACVA
jgi:hypothetical protein